MNECCGTLGRQRGVGWGTEAYRWTDLLDGGVRGGKEVAPDAHDVGAGDATALVRHLLVNESIVRTEGKTGRPSRSASVNLRTHLDDHVLVVLPVRDDDPNGRHLVRAVELHRGAVCGSRICQCRHHQAACSLSP